MGSFSLLSKYSIGWIVVSITFLKMAYWLEKILKFFWGYFLGLFLFWLIFMLLNLIIFWPVNYYSNFKHFPQEFSRHIQNNNYIVILLIFLLANPYIWCVYYYSDINILNNLITLLYIDKNNVFKILLLIFYVILCWYFMHFEKNNISNQQGIHICEFTFSD